MMTQFQHVCDGMIDADTNLEHKGWKIDADTNLEYVHDGIIDGDTNQI